MASPHNKDRNYGSWVQNIRLAYALDNWLFLCLGNDQRPDIPQLDQECHNQDTKPPAILTSGVRSSLASLLQFIFQLVGRVDLFPTRLAVRAPRIWLPLPAAPLDVEVIYGKRVYGQTFTTTFDQRNFPFPEKGTILLYKKTHNWGAGDGGPNRRTTPSRPRHG